MYNAPIIVEKAHILFNGYGYDKQRKDNLWSLLTAVYKQGHFVLEFMHSVLTSIFDIIFHCTTVTSIQQSQIQVHDIATARVEPSGVCIHQTAFLVPEPNGSGNETRLV